MDWRWWINRSTSLAAPYQVIGARSFAVESGSLDPGRAAADATFACVCTRPAILKRAMGKGISGLTVNEAVGGC